MKKVISVVFLILFAFSANVHAGTDAEFSNVVSFEGGSINSVRNGIYAIENLQAREQCFVPDEREVGYAYGKFGKNAEDASLAVKFNQTELDTSDISNPTWAQVRVTNTFTAPQKVELGQKIHYSMLYADENSTAGFVMVPTGRASSGKSFGRYEYIPISPKEYNASWNRTGNAFIIKYGSWVYFADTSSGIAGQRSLSKKWHRYDIVVDTQDESQNGLQTVKMYYEGRLCTYGILDSDTAEDGVQYISELTGFRFEISPSVSKISGSESGYKCAGDAVYIDDISVTVLDGEDDIEISVDGKGYGGSYHSGDIAELTGPFTAEFPIAPVMYGEGAEASYRVFYPDEDGNISVALGDGTSDTKLFLWQKSTAVPLSKPYTFTPYNPVEKVRVDFDENSEVVKAEIGDGVPEAESGVMSGDLGKTENFFRALNGTGAVSAADTEQAEIAVTADINTEYESNEALWLSFEYGHKSAAYPKSIYVKPRDGLARELITISAEGDVSVGQIPCSDVKVIHGQWYRFDVVLNSNLTGTLNTVTVYINGIKCAENFPLYLGETALKSGQFIEKLKMAYNVASADNAEADGIYLDNLRVRLCSGFLPEISEYKVKSSDAVYNMITDSRSFTLEQYGQEAASYIDSLKSIESAVFVQNDGTENAELTSAGEGYLKVTANGGYNIYYSLIKGTDDKVRESIAPVENDYNPDTENWYAYSAPDIDIITQDGNILNVAYENPVKAGSLGKISVSGENFTAGDTPVRFWGCNVILSALAPENEQADKMADMIASYGFNLVRFHGFKDLKSLLITEDGKPGLNTEAMNKICYFIDKLSEKGIYVYIDLGRIIFDDDVKDNLIEKMPPSGDVFWFEEDYQKIQLDFAKSLLTYTDPYTGKRLCDNNCIAGVQCVNEAYIYVGSFESTLGFESDEYQYYYAMMNKKFDKWYREAYPSYKTDYDKIGLSKEEANGKLITIGSILQRGLVMNENGGWGYSPWSKTARKENLIRFFNEMQADFYAQMQEMFDENNINVPMTGSTVWNSNDMAILDANYDTKFIDTHVYWGHPLNGFSAGKGIQFKGAEMQSMLKSNTLGIIGYIMNRKPYNKPYTISEWNECAENQYMSEAPLMMAAYSKYQNWNPMLFLFTGEALTNYKDAYIDDVFKASDNPIMLSTLQAAALTWRSVSEAEKSCYTDYSDIKSYQYSKHHPEVYNEATGLWTPASTQWENYDIMTKNPTVGMLAKTGASLREPPENDDISSAKEEALESGVYTTDTGELTFDSNNDTFTVNTAKSKATAGFFKGETSIGDTVKFKLDNEFATLYVNSVTDGDISSSGRLLLTAAGKAINTDQVLQRSGNPYVLQTGKAPVLMEQITGTVMIKTDSAMKVYALTSSGERKKQISAVYKDGWLTIPLSLSDQCVNYEIIYE